MGAKKELARRKKAKKLRIVFDTNIWVSLILNRHLSANFAEVLADKQRFVICMSGQMLSELARALSYPKIARILGESNVDVRTALAAVVERVDLHTVTEGEIDEIKSDQSDNRILECASEVEAEFIVSGDRHLLDLKVFDGIPIVTARDFLKVIDG